jgi:peptidoglycan/xylan/chitin deacetylase (PgdA/CDA1 family)
LRAVNERRSAVVLIGVSSPAPIVKRLLPMLTALGLVLPLGATAVEPAKPAAAPVELHARLADPGTLHPRIALTLDACGGGYDAELIEFLIAQRIPATVFATRKWLDRNPAAVAVLKAHAALFDIEDHGAMHVPAVFNRRIHGLAGASDEAALAREVLGGAAAIEQATGVAPRWYRGATAVYDPRALDAIARLGFRVAGFSLNGDAGATLPRRAVYERVRRAQPGDVILAHMNKPAGETSEGLQPALLELRARGFVFVRLADAELRPVP